MFYPQNVFINSLSRDVPKASLQNNNKRLSYTFRAMHYFLCVAGSKLTYFYFLRFPDSIEPN